MICYIVLYPDGSVKALTPNKKLADNLADDDSFIHIHDTDDMKIIFDGDKVILENKRLIKQIDIGVNVRKFSEVTKEICERKRW